MSKTNYPLVRVSWEEIVDLCSKIAKQIKDEKKEIDLIVPILRGGMPIALILSSMLKVEDMACVHIRRSVDDTPNSDFKRKPINKGITNVDKIKGANILIVDDTLDSKITLDYTIKLLKKYHPRNIETAILYNFNKKYFGKIYNGEEVKEYKWIIFPWEDNNILFNDENNKEEGDKM